MTLLAHLCNQNGGRTGAATQPALCNENRVNNLIEIELNRLDTDRKWAKSQMTVRSILII